MTKRTPSNELLAITQLSANAPLDQVNINLLNQIWRWYFEQGLRLLNESPTDDELYNVASDIPEEEENEATKKYVHQWP